LVLPCILVLCTMMFYPIFQTVVFSFSKLSFPSFSSSYIGLDNFVKVFSKPEISKVLTNTLVWIVCGIASRFILGFWAAIIFNIKVKGSMFFRVLCLLPWTVPSIAAANLWRWLLKADGGLFNEFLQSAGLGQFTNNWIGDPHTALYAVLVAYAWQGYPFVMLMLLAGMQSIPKELYEAGKIDGAHSVQLFRYITIPGLMPIILVVLLLELINGLNTSDMIMVLTGGGPAGATETIGLFIYRIGFINFDFGGASAISLALLLFVIMFFVCYGIAANHAMKRRDVQWSVK
jgi:multiple sugar transport system permease protein